MSKKYSLADMPIHFLERTVDFLTIYDILSMSRTCKFFYNLFKTDNIWERVFEKYFGLCSDMDYEKLKKIGGFRGICKTICEQLKKTDCSYMEKDTFLFGDIVANEFNASFGGEPCCLEEKNSSHSNLLIRDRDKEHCNNHEYDISSDHENESENEIHSQLYYNPSAAALTNDSAKVQKLIMCNRIAGIPCAGMVEWEFPRHRLSYLVKRAEKLTTCNPDNFLPGDQTDHLALKYHSVEDDEEEEEDDDDD